jgi:hypothetical protein
MLCVEVVGSRVQGRGTQGAQEVVADSVPYSCFGSLIEGTGGCRNNEATDVRVRAQLRRNSVALVVGSQYAHNGQGDAIRPAVVVGLTRALCSSRNMHKAAGRHRCKEATKQTAQSPFS